MHNRLPESDSYTLIVLSGGQGSRLGGADKGLLRLDGQPFVRRLINRFIGPACTAVLISANRNLEQYAQLGHGVITDVRAGFTGPLAGIEACLLQQPQGPVVIVPADMPYLPHDLPHRLLAQLTRQSIVIAHDGEQPQPLCMAMHAGPWLASLSNWLDRGGRSVHRWLAGKPVHYVRFPDVAEFSNINEKTDLHRQNGQVIQIGAQSALIGYDRRHDYPRSQ